jgi:hypothetical protein
VKEVVFNSFPNHKISCPQDHNKKHAKDYGIHIIKMIQVSYKLRWCTWLFDLDVFPINILKLTANVMLGKIVDGDAYPR